MKSVAPSRGARAGARRRAHARACKGSRSTRPRSPGSPWRCPRRSHPPPSPCAGWLLARPALAPPPEPPRDAAAWRARIVSVPDRLGDRDPLPAPHPGRRAPRRLRASRAVAARARRPGPACAPSSGRPPGARNPGGRDPAGRLAASGIALQAFATGPAVRIARALARSRRSSARGSGSPRRPTGRCLPARPRSSGPSPPATGPASTPATTDVVRAERPRPHPRRVGPPPRRRRARARAAPARPPPPRSSRIAVAGGRAPRGRAGAPADHAPRTRSPPARASRSCARRSPSGSPRRGCSSRARRAPSNVLALAGLAPPRARTRAPRSTRRSSSPSPRSAGSCSGRARSAARSRSAARAPAPGARWLVEPLPRRRVRHRRRLPRDRAGPRRSTSASSRSSGVARQRRRDPHRLRAHRGRDARRGGGRGLAPSPTPLLLAARPARDRAPRPVRRRRGAALGDRSAVASPGLAGAAAFVAARARGAARLRGAGARRRRGGGRGVSCSSPGRSARRRPARAAASRSVFVSVGQGDGALLRLPDGSAVLVDAGGAPDGGADPGARDVVPLLRDLGVRRLAAVFVSHPHPDHVLGLAAVARRRSPSIASSRTATAATGPRARCSRRLHPSVLLARRRLGARGGPLRRPRRAARDGSRRTTPRSSCASRTGTPPSSSRATSRPPARRRPWRAAASGRTS